MTEQERIKEIEVQIAYLRDLCDPDDQPDYQTHYDAMDDAANALRWLLDELKRVTAERDKLRSACDNAAQIIERCAVGEPSARGHAALILHQLRQALQDGEKE